MRKFRFLVIGLTTFIFITNTIFWRKAIAVMLCGVLSFNSTSCYSFLGKDEIVNAAVPPRTNILATDESSISHNQEQKIAGLLDLPNIPISIPGVPSGNPLEIATNAVIKEVGEAVGVGSPLLLDQKTAYPDVSDQVKDFHPQKLTITSVQDLQKPLSPGDYSIDVIAYCTQFSIHAPGQGLPYKLAPLMGKQAPAISALLSRGTLQGIAPATLNANAWRIQAGLPLKQWPSQDQALIHKLIPEYEKGLEGDYLQQIENTYNQYRIVPGIPSFNDLLRQAGAPGQTVLQLRQARQTLADQTIAAERLPDMLYEPTGDGLPRVLPPAKDSSPSPWAEIQPGVFARFTVIEGNLGKNLFEFRVTPKAKSAAINNKSGIVATKELDKNVLANQQTRTPATPASVVCDSTHDTYSKDRPAQALIPACVSNQPTDNQSEIVLTRATTIDAESVDVIYKASDASIQGQSIHFDVYRSSTQDFDPVSSRKKEIKEVKEIFDETNSDPHLHAVNLIFQDKKALKPDTAFPYVVVVATYNGKQSTTYFRKYLLGAISHGFNRWNQAYWETVGQILENSPPTERYIPTNRSYTGIPIWETTMAKTLEEKDKYDYAIPFDWTETCAIKKPNMAVQAGLDLGNKILNWISSHRQQHSGDVVDIHLIGHSRGSVVVTQALKDIVPYLREIHLGSYIELTLLDPHPANNKSEEASFQRDKYGNMTTLAVIAQSYLEQFQSIAIDPDLEIPKGIKEIELWYQKTNANDLTNEPDQEDIMNLWGVDDTAISNHSGVQIHINYLTIPGKAAVGHNQVPEIYEKQIVETGKLNRGN